MEGKAKEAFFEWFYKNWGSYPTRIDDWMDEDKFACYSLFFGQKLTSEAAIKKAVEIYNKNNG